MAFPAPTVGVAALTGLTDASVEAAETKRPTAGSPRLALAEGAAKPAAEPAPRLAPPAAAPDEPPEPPAPGRPSLKRVK